MPKIKLNKSNIETIGFPTIGQKLYCDRDMPGFYLIVGSRAKTFVVQKDIRGRSVRYTIGKLGHFTPEEARRIAKEKLYLMATGINPNDEDRKAESKLITLQMVLECYLKSRKSLKPQTRAAYQYLLTRYLESWKAKDITLITKEMVGQRHRVIADNNGPSTANMVILGLIQDSNKTIKEVLSRKNIEVEEDSPLPEQLKLFDGYYAKSN